MLTVVERVLSAALRATMSPDAGAWLDHARAGPADGSRATLLDAYARTALHVGRGAITIEDEGLQQLREAAPGIGFERWTQDDAGRALILIGRRHKARSTAPSARAD